MEYFKPMDGPYGSRKPKADPHSVGLDHFLEQFTAGPAGLEGSCTGLLDPAWDPRSPRFNEGKLSGK